jgi:hypothetical protein
MPSSGQRRKGTRPADSLGYPAEASTAQAQLSQVWVAAVACTSITG